MPSQLSSKERCGSRSDDRGRDRSDAATSRGAPEAGGGKERHCPAASGGVCLPAPQSGPGGADAELLAPRSEHLGCFKPPRMNTGS